MVERYVAEASVRVCPRPLTPPPPPYPPGNPPRRRDREKIYGHANYPLKLRETSTRPLRRPQYAAITGNFQNSAHKTFRETTVSCSATRFLDLPNFVIGFPTFPSLRTNIPFLSRV